MHVALGIIWMQAHYEEKRNIASEPIYIADALAAENQLAMFAYAAE